jgi:periplasmic protein CpxP/Spy
MAFSRTAKVSLAAIGLVAMIGGATALAQDAQDGFGRHGRGGQRGAMADFRQLGLSDDQKTQIHAAMSGHRDEFKALSDRARSARQAQQAAMEQVPMNEQQVRAAATEVAAVEADMAVLHARVHEQVYSILTPDQQTQLKALKDQRAAMRAQRRAQWQQQKSQSTPPPATPQQ